ncbi:MAG: family 2A encapsulin nanocompartment shell protein [Calothrix sp. MO_167.B12]|nr:family 2A encapsulin nanocompartment shell protein [Calothrix sp. MO_167.B12]
MVNTANNNQPQQSLSTNSARNLTSTTKTPPQMQGSTPRWLLKLLPWVEVPGGTFRVNRRDIQVQEGTSTNEEGEKNIEILSGREGEPELSQTFVDYDDFPKEYPLQVAQTILRVHTRVSDLYTDPFDQFQEQLRLTIEGLMERKEREIINNAGINGDADKAFGLVNVVSPSMRIPTRNGVPTPDDFDELLAKLWKQPAFFLAHPKAIAAFGRECTRRGLPPATVEIFGSPFITWRGVPIISSNKLPIDSEGKSKILLMRVGQQTQGVIGLHKTGLVGEQQPSLSVRFMGIDNKAIADYLVTTYFSAAVLVPDALGMLENVDINRYYDEDGNSRKRPAANIKSPSTTTTVPTPTKPVTTSDKSPTKTLWQIGKPGGPKEFNQGQGWTEEHNYIVGQDTNPINHPSLPAVLTSPKGIRPKRKASTNRYNITFTLEHDYGDGELTLFYDRYGAETDSIFLDNQLLIKIKGAGEGKLKQSEISIGTLSQGEHTLSITTTGQTKDKAHLIDYLKLMGIDPGQTESNNNILLTPANSNLNYYQGQEWITDSGYKFIFQDDGNLVLYNPANSPIWASNTHGKGANIFAVQADGNVVIYAGPKPLWATNTHGHKKAYLAIQNDGNVVVYQGSQAIWATNTWGK